MIDQIENLLVGNGNLIAAAHRMGKSLSGPDRGRILRIRQQARDAGYCDRTIFAYELEGQQGRRGTSPHPLCARFIGSQEMGVLGFSVRFYNIEGDHVLNHSTVSVHTLVHNGILPLDLSIFGLAREYVKSLIFA